MLFSSFWFCGDNSKGSIRLGTRHLQAQGCSSEGREWAAARPGSPADPWPARGAEALKHSHEWGETLLKALRGRHSIWDPGQTLEGPEEEDYRQRWLQVQRPRKRARVCRRSEGLDRLPGDREQGRGPGPAGVGGYLDFLLSAMGNPRKISNRSRMGSDYLWTQHSHYKF